MNWTLDEIATAVGGKLDQSKGVEVRGYSIDSRSIKRGELFFAISGPRFDGHDYVWEAARKGAAAAVVASELWRGAGWTRRHDSWVGGGADRSPWSSGHGRRPGCGSRSSYSRLNRDEEVALGAGRVGRGGNRLDRVQRA